MNYRITTGYFVWNFLTWTMVFVLSAAIVCLLTYAVIRARTGRFVKVTSVSAEPGEILSLTENKIRTFRKECIEPWINLVQIHVIAIAVLFALFMIAISCRWWGG
ncbi:MAG: hypothetical protein LLF78_00165 [Synergistaceae bacterium]|nr:hypothetical protein [Synergistaceae bacterium]